MYVSLVDVHVVMLERVVLFGITDSPQDEAHVQLRIMDEFHQSQYVPSQKQIADTCTRKVKAG